LAERWQVKPSHVYRLTREGALPTVRLGRYYRYRVEVIDQFERGGGSSGGAVQRMANPSWHRSIEPNPVDVYREMSR
jgi:excisionase family DNA binding protein